MPHNVRWRSPRARSRLGWLLLAAGLVGITGLALFWILTPSAHPASSTAPEASMVQAEAEPTPAGKEAGPANVGPQVATQTAHPGPALVEPAVWGEAFLAEPPSARAAWLNAWWEQAQAEHPPAALREWLLAFLRSGVDAATGEPFAVGPGGGLVAAPTLRVQVLDWLGALDPEMAAVQAREILDASPSPDEWAVALRNYGRALAAPSEDAYYVGRVAELLQRPSWQAAPTRGYLEAFDAAVHSGAGEVVPALLHVSLEAPHPGTRRAAAMALDNLAGDDPLLVANAVTRRNAPVAAQPTFRASLVARLDPQDPDHVAALRRYLLEVPHGADELEVFASTFPNAHDFAAHYLLTHQPGRSLHEMAAVDRAAYELVRAWQADPAFAPRRETLNRLESRLRGFLESATRGGFLAEEERP